MDSSRTVFDTVNGTRVLIAVVAGAVYTISVGLPAVTRHTRMLWICLPAGSSDTGDMSICAIRKVRAVVQDFLTINYGAYACNAASAGSTCHSYYIKPLL